MGVAWAKTFGRLFGKKEIRILVFGLDAAGKTTMLYRMKLGKVVTTIPTIGFNVETVVYKNISFTVWDVGGRDKIRPLYRHYYPNTHVVIFMIDSNDRERFPDVREEIDRFRGEDELRNVVFVAMANKQDLPNTATPVEIHDMINKDWKGKDTLVFPTSAAKGEGLFEAYDWICEEVNGLHAKKTVSEPWKQVAKDVTEDGKAGLKWVNYAWNSIASTFRWT